MTNTNRITIGEGKVTAMLDILIYENDGIVYTYAPALDLVGYGSTMEEAKASFAVVVSDYFEFGVKRGTLEEDLIRHNWVKEVKHDEYSLPNAWLLFNTNKQMQDIYSGRFVKESIPVTYAAC